VNDVQYMMAFIDWQKYGGCFRKLQEYPQNVSVCAYTMLGEFSQKDLLRGLPADAPWQLINEIKSLGARWTQTSKLGLRAYVYSSIRGHPATSRLRLRLGSESAPPPAAAEDLTKPRSRTQVAAA